MTIPLPGIALCDHRDWLRELVDLGYTDLWTMETDGFDAFTPLACAAVWAPELRLGTAIASVFSRGPALLAQTAAALADAAPGRFVLTHLSLRVDDLDSTIRAVEQAAGGEPRDLVQRLGVFPSTDSERARGHCRRLITAYLNVPAYAAMHDWLGHADELEPLWRAWREGDRAGALAAVSDDLVDALFVHGSPGACREQVQSFVEAGVTTPVLSILPTSGGEAELRSALRELAPR